MKRTILFTFLVLAAFTAYSQNSEEKEIVSGPEITFDEESYDFGDIEQGDVVEYTFKFKNSGIEPLVISNVAVTCGCTATKWPKEPIAPGEKGEMTIKFNSAGKMGAQNKVIRVYSNASESVATVSIVATVLPRKKDN